MVEVLTGGGTTHQLRGTHTSNERGRRTAYACYFLKKLSSPMVGARQVAKVAQVRGNPTATHTQTTPLPNVA